MAFVMDLGRADYPSVHALQQRLLEQVAAGEIGNTVIIVEHDPVYTVGRKRDAIANVLAPGDVPVVEVERGGDVTWHGPGQLVAYPILRLVGADRDLHAHLHRLEDLMMEVCAAFGLKTGRDARNTGVWHEGKKLGSIGIACRRWVTWHGLALNVNPDLTYFERIHPCGFDATIMTSMEAALGRPVDFGEVRRALVARVLDW
jgi:lipoate-protein ligase B